ncbi:MAG: hypothetical protein ACLVJO_09775 [[Clostridium] scindens]
MDISLAWICRMTSVLCYQEMRLEEAYIEAWKYAMIGCGRMIRMASQDR